MANIDTLEYYDKLIAEKTPDKQARVHVRTLNTGLDGVTTKKDLNKVEQDFKSEIINLKEDLKSSFDDKITILNHDMKAKINEVKFFVMYTLIGIVTIMLILPIILKYYGWHIR